MSTPVTVFHRAVACPLALLLGFAVVTAFATTGLADEGPDFRAGAATSNITPPLGVRIVGGWGQPEAEYIHDQLYARCLVLDDGETKLVIVICDNLSVGREVFDEAKRRLEEKTGIPADNMLMAATHTHSAPTARQGNSLTYPEELTEYQQFIADRVVDGVRTAMVNLEPARIGWGRGEEPDQVFNRRWIVDDPEVSANPFGGHDQVRMNPPRNHESLVEPAGPIDPEISFIAVRAVEDDRPIALLANYSLHYVGGVRRGHISADYFGMFADRIQQLMRADHQHPPFVGILSNGTSGDINNNNYGEPSPGRREPYEQMRRVANIVAAEVDRAYQAIEYQDHVQLGARKTELQLDVRKPDDDLLARAHRVLEKPEDELTHRRERTYARRIISLHESPDHVDIWLQSLRIGDVGIAAIPFEVFVETGLQIKDESPLPMSFTISLANGGYGYLPTPRHHELGGYETWLGTSRVAPESEPAMVEILLEQLGDLYAGD